MLLFGACILLAAPGLFIYYVSVQESAAALPILPIVGAFLVPAAAAFTLSVALFGRAELVG